MNEPHGPLTGRAAAHTSDAEHHSPDLPMAKAPRLAVFGGSFDPVHNGHLALAEAVVTAGCADEVLFVPARKPPHKRSRELTAGQHRMAMLRSAIEPFAAFSVSDIELERSEGFSFTFDTLTVLRQVFPEHELLFLMGMDSLHELHTWHHAGELVQHFGFIVYPRPGVNAPSLAELSDRFGIRNARKLQAAIKSELPVFPFAATAVREACSRHADISALCPDAVCRYIEIHGLYNS